MGLALRFGRLPISSGTVSKRLPDSCRRSRAVSRPISGGSVARLLPANDRSCASRVVMCHVRNPFKMH